ncbi:phosphatase PAP2 family protein [Candidatus Saccharibacteria bacterium]|nr:phosphatase PAP2 family protein [Candidatus Saccharibacteria bacterium]
MQWEKITDIILIAALALLGVFAILGLTEWIRRKSLKKVDRELLAMLPSLVLMAATYFIFDELLILNTRPNGSGEPSFPSSHTMATTTIFLMAIIALPKYVKNQPLRIVLDVVMLILIALVSVGRVAANMHWASDVIAALIFSVIFAALYLLILKLKKKEPNHA